MPKRSPPLLPSQARDAWQRLPEKARKGVVGAAYDTIISLIDASGHALQSAVFEALFPGLPVEKARRALATGITNRPPLSADSNPPLRLRVERASKAAGDAQERLWFEGVPAPSAAAQTPVNPRYVPAEFIEGRALKATGSELVAYSEALRQALLESETNPAPKPEINRGQMSMRHGTSRDGKFIATQARLHRGMPGGEIDEEHGIPDAYAKDNPRESRKEKPTVKELPQGPALEAMFTWALDQSETALPLLTLLGDYGTGKTSHAMQFARVLNGEIENEVWAAHKTATPKKKAACANHLSALFIDLAELAGVVSLASLALDELLFLVLRKRDRGVKHPDDVRHYLDDARAGKLIFVFDGLDELLKSEPQVLHNVFNQLLSVLGPETFDPAGSGEGRSQARIIVSCRTHYFRSVERQHAFFNTRRRGLATSEQYFTLTLLPWGEGEIETYLRHRLSEADAAALLQTIRTTYNLEELASRPVLLAMMSEQIGALLRQAADGEPITAARLYSITVAEWIARDDGKHALAPEHKPLLMGALAAAMWQDETEMWSADKLDAWLLRTVNALFPGRYGPQHAEAIQNDLRTATFIVRPHSAQFNFAHKSFKEYFVARFWINAIEHAADGRMEMQYLRNLLPDVDLNVEALGFLRELWAAEEKRIAPRDRAARAAVFWRLLQQVDAPYTQTKQPDIESESLPPAPPLHRTLFNMLVELHLANDAKAQDQIAKLLTPQPANLRGLDFIETVWQDLELKGLPSLDLRDANLRGMHARRCRFGQVLCDESTNWSQAIFRGCDVSQFDWGNSIRGGMLVRPRGRQTGSESAGPVEGLGGEWKVPFGASPIQSVAFAPNAKTAATTDESGVARLWDVDTGREIRAFKGDFDTGSGLAFSPDGGALLAGGDDGALLWDVATGRELMVFRGHTASVTSVAFSADGKQVLTGSFDTTARLWEVTGGRELSVLRGHSDAVRSVAVGADGKLLLTGGDDETARVWDAVNGRELLVLRGHGDIVMSVAFSPDGGKVLTGGREGTSRLWDIKSGRELGVYGLPGQSVSSVAFAPSGKTALVSGFGDGVHLWDVFNGRKLLEFGENRHAIHSAVFGPDGKTVLTGGFDEVAHLWDVTRARELRALAGHSNIVLCRAVSPDGKAILITSDECVTRLFEVSRGKELKVLWELDDFVMSGVFDPKGRTVLIAGAENTVSLHDTETGKEIMTYEGHSDSVISLAVSPDGKRVLTGSDDKTARLWDLASGRVLRTFEGYKESVWGVAFSPDGANILTGGDDGAAQLWDAASGRKLRVFKGRGRFVVNVAFSPDGQKVLAGFSGGVAYLWDTATGRELAMFNGRGGSPLGIAFSPDGEKVLTGSDDDFARFWDATSGQELLVLDRGGQGGAVVAFGSDGRTALTISDQGIIHLWNLAVMLRDGNPLTAEHCHLPAYRISVPLPRPPFERSWADFTADGRLLAWNDAAADHWLFRVRDGVSEPVEAAL